jgi:hypothetical protein
MQPLLMFMPLYWDKMPLSSLKCMELLLQASLNRRIVHNHPVLPVVCGIRRRFRCLKFIPAERRFSRSAKSGFAAAFGPAGGRLFPFPGFFAKQKTQAQKRQGCRF